MSDFHHPSRDAELPLKPAAAGSARRPYGLAVEIVVILAIKLSLLFIIWYLFFSSPQATHMQLPPERMQQRLVETPVSPSNPPPHTFNSGNKDHATR
jgi:hypothetical protein